ncbi:glycosyltransferase family A protein [Telluribacter sp.]|jgi:glycosyltransferase involved in cell wall biosynthesis|uniref:glycosyltransferase family 2 protein n=1 Tax=Telluribacter sp. TaxID=1978767 RepID=UPI002E119A33|nr:glycosyltransferase family A protein [Telluribacter sp.]
MYMPTSTATISVIIPAFNGSAFIERALESILRQSHIPTEILVVDDGSTDNTPEIVARFGSRVRYLLKANGGVASARNEGIRQTSGEYIAFLDQDDYWPDDMLEKTLARFEKEPQWQVVMGLSKVVFEEGAIRERFAVGEEQLTAPFILVSSALFRRTAFELVGLFNEELHAANDLDWFNRIREDKVPLVVLPTISLYYSRHSTNASNDTEWLRMEMMKALKFSLDRRRIRPEVEAIPTLNSYSVKP